MLAQRTARPRPDRGSRNGPKTPHRPTTRLGGGHQMALAKSAVRSHLVELEKSFQEWCNT
eukprot:5255779-Prymnesium_polylepis.1